MLFFSYLSLAVVWPMAALCLLDQMHWVNHADFDTLSSLHRRANTTGTVAITGIMDSAPQNRLEIRELEKNADAWNIYLLGSVISEQPHT